MTPLGRGLEAKVVISPCNPSFLGSHTVRIQRRTRALEDRCYRALLRDLGLRPHYETKLCMRVILALRLYYKLEP